MKLHNPVTRLAAIKLVRSAESSINKEHRFGGGSRTESWVKRRRESHVTQNVWKGTSMAGNLVGSGCKLMGSVGNKWAGPGSDNNRSVTSSRVES